MPVWIALLRGINVGGHRKMPMAELRALAGELGFEDAATYVQSGNLVFRSPEEDRGEIGALLESGIARRFGFDANVVTRNRVDWEAVIAANPFPKAADQPKSLHALFLARVADAAAERLAAFPREDEEFAIVGETLYLLTPSGMGRSRFGAAAERLIGVPTTARNWNSVMKIAELAHSL